MKDEIKEILKELNKIIDNTSYNEEFTYFQKSHICKLLDYITNLQEENDDLKQRLENEVATNLLRQQENERLKKQLEYINGGEYLNQVKWERDFNEKIIENYKSRIDKAIEVISKEFLCYDNESDEYIQGKKTINILNGGDE